jgi:DNA polymerase III epsilon subunit-like protein
MIAFLDIETGGFSKTKNGVCEIAFIAVDNDLNITDTYHVFIKPYARENSNELVSYKAEAMKVNCLTIEFLEKEGISVVEATDKLVTFLVKNGVTTLIGHNSKAFDVPRVEYLLNRFADASIRTMSQKDTMLMAKRRLNLKSCKLGDLCSHFGIINKQEHSALEDTKATIELYKKLI